MLFKRRIQVFTDHVPSTRKGYDFSHVCLSGHRGPYPMSNWGRQEGGSPSNIKNQVGKRPSAEGPPRKEAAPQASDLRLPLTSE